MLGPWWVRRGWVNLSQPAPGIDLYRLRESVAVSKAALLLARTALASWAILLWHSLAKDLATWVLDGRSNTSIKNKVQVPLGCACFGFRCHPRTSGWLAVLSRNRQNYDFSFVGEQNQWEVSLK